MDGTGGLTGTPPSARPATPSGNAVHRRYCPDCRGGRPIRSGTYCPHGRWTEQLVDLDRSSADSFRRNTASNRSSANGRLALRSVTAFRADDMVIRAMCRWFSYWERRAPRLYRVVGVAAGSVGTAVVVGRATRSRWWRHLPLSVASWALLGKIEGDERDRRAASDRLWPPQR